MGIKPSSQNNNINVNQHIGTAYDNVAIVAENIDDITLVADAIEGGLEGKVSSIQAGDNIEIDDTDPINPIVSAVIPELTDYVEEVVGGTNVTVDNTDPKNPIINCEATGGQVDTVVGGTNVTIDNTDPINPIINCQDSGGQVDEIVAGDNITVDNTDPTRPIISSSGGETPGFLMQDAEDAELNTGSNLSSNGYTFIYKGGEADTNGDCADFFGSIRCWNYDLNGLLVPVDELHNTEVTITVNSEEPVVATINVSSQADGLRFHITNSGVAPSLVPGDVIRIVSENIEYDELVEGDAWVRNNLGKFVPKQVALKSDLEGLGEGKMEDASDAERVIATSTISFNKGTVFDPTPSDTVGLFAVNNTISIYVSTTDISGETVDIEAMNGEVYTIIPDDDLSLAGNTTLECYTSGEYNVIKWSGGGVNPYNHNKISLIKDGDPLVASLEEGDAWMYNEATSKFRPAPMVPTIVVTEYPTEPLPNTLYIKVEE